MEITGRFQGKEAVLFLKDGPHRSPICLIFFFSSIVFFHHLADFVYSLTSSLCAKVKSSHYVAVFIKPFIIWDFFPQKFSHVFRKLMFRFFFSFSSNLLSACLLSSQHAGLQKQCVY